MVGELSLPSITDPDRLVMSRGNLFSVTTTSGNIAPAGARELGVFHQDTRHLSYYELALPGGAPTKLSADAISAVLTQIDLTATDVEFGGFLDEPVNFLHVRRKQHLDDEFVDQIVFTNYLGHAVDIDFEVRFAADFADIFEVRGARREVRGEYLAPALGDGATVELRYRGRDRCTYVTRLRFTPEPASLSEKVAHFRLHLEPGEAQLQEVLVTPVRFPPEAEPKLRTHPRKSFDVRTTHGRAEAAAFQRRAARLRCDNRLVLLTLERALNDVHALRIMHDGQWIVGAGIPWYAAPFGRDSLITSAQMLPIARDLAVETLRFLGRHQGTTEDVRREEEPGKIMHELRRGEMANTGEIPHSPYYGTVDATPLYVILAGETWRWTADRDLLAEVWTHVRAAMDWVERRTENGTRFLSYKRRAARGLDNQGWKDSHDGVSFPDGRKAEPPISLVEVQGYCVDAWRHGARLAREVGESALAAAWEARIEPFRRRIDDEMWNDRTQYYALALDGEGRQVPTLTSNPGHLLWSRAVPRARASRVADVLLSPEMWTGWGVRTLSRGQSVYNPLSYHNGTVWPHDNAIAGLGMARYGLQGQTVRILDALLDASGSFRQHRLPELFCGMGRGEREFLVQYPVSCSPQAWASGALFMLLQGSLGLDPNAAEGRLRIWNPRLPTSVRRLELHGVRVGRARVSLRFVRTGDRTHADVLDVKAGPLRVEIEIS
jgi:glycogen debranching enzyme